MRRLMIIFPIKSLSAEDMEYRINILQKIADKNTTIEYMINYDGPNSIESRYDEIIGVNTLIDECIKSEKGGFDAVIIWCAVDPFVPVIRELLDIPVIGPGETSILIALGLAKNFTIIVPRIEDSNLNEELATRLNIMDSLCSIRGIGMSVLEMRKNREELINRVINAANNAIKEDNSHSFILGCMGMIGIASEVQKKINLPVIDPAIVSIKYAEMIIDLRLKYSRITYPKYTGL